MDVESITTDIAVAEAKLIINNPFIREDTLARVTILNYWGLYIHMILVVTFFNNYNINFN